MIRYTRNWGILGAIRPATPANARAIQRRAIPTWISCLIWTSLRRERLPTLPFGAGQASKRIVPSCEPGPLNGPPSGWFIVASGVRPAASGSADERGVNDQTVAVAGGAAKERPGTSNKVEMGLCRWPEHTHQRRCGLAILRQTRDHERQFGPDRRRHRNPVARAQAPQLPERSRLTRRPIEVSGDDGIAGQPRRDTGAQPTRIGDRAWNIHASIGQQPDALEGGIHADAVDPNADRRVVRRRRC